MPEFKIFKAKDKNDLERCYLIMKELRKKLSFNDYMEIYEQAHSADGYEIVGIINKLGKKFYEKHNRQLRSVAYKKKLS